MRSKIESDESRGELRLEGRRYMAMSMDALCDHLDALVGTKVAEVIVKKLELQEGKAEAERYFRDHPNSKVEEFIDNLIEYDALTGVGITTINFSNNPTAEITIQISNPYVKRTEGSSRALLFSWWCGALSSALHRELNMESISYDAPNDAMKCILSQRTSQ